MIDMLRDDRVRSILESGGFVLEEVLDDAGFVLKVRMCLMAPPMNNLLHASCFICAAVSPTCHDTKLVKSR